MQAQVVLALASNSDSPITSPITAPVVNPTPTPQPSSDPITSPITNPTPTPKPTQTNQSNNSSSDSSTGGPAEAPVCGDSKPVSAPKLLVASANGKNQVTLIWAKALDPVTYYLLAYGTKPGQLEYGNPNVGDRNTTSYTVKGLENGKTYYFKVRAGNGCTPGDYSNERAAKATGDNISGPAIGFKAGVLGSSKQADTQNAEFKPITAAQPARITKSTETFLTKVFTFLTHLFKR